MTSPRLSENENGIPGTAYSPNGDVLVALVALLAAELAPRVAAELASSSPAPAEAEPWHLLDVAEAAARLGRSTRWVRDRAKRGDLPHVRLDGGALAFDLDDLKAFAQARRVSADAPLALASRLQRGAEQGFYGPHRLSKPRVPR